LHITRYTFTLLAIFHPLSGVYSSFADWFLVIWGMAFAAYGIGYIVSLSTRFDISMVITIVVCIAFSFTAGLSPHISTVEDSWGPARVFFDLSFDRWGAEGLFFVVLLFYDLSILHANSSSTVLALIRFQVSSLC